MKPDNADNSGDKEGEADVRLAWRSKPEAPFLVFLVLILVAYLGLLLALVFANVMTIHVDDLLKALDDENVLASLRLTAISCTATAILSVFVAVPVGYVLSRFRFRGRSIIDSILDIPLILPPLVVGLSLLILFNRSSPTLLFLILGLLIFAAAVIAVLGRPGSGRTQHRNLIPSILGISGLLCLGAAAAFHQCVPDHSLEQASSRLFGLPVTFHPIGVVLAQFPVAAAFAVRTMKTTFDQISPRYEDIARTLGCNRAMAFSRVVLPIAVRGAVAAGTLAWARALGEFGPILVFAGATRQHTEVLSTSVFLEINIGNLPGAAAISLMMILIALATILIVRLIADARTSPL